MGTRWTGANEGVEDQLAAEPGGGATGPANGSPPPPELQRGHTEGRRRPAETPKLPVRCCRVIARSSSHSVDSSRLTGNESEDEVRKR